MGRENQSNQENLLKKVIELIDRGALLRVTVYSIKSLIVDQTSPVLASGKLVLQKKMF